MWVIESKLGCARFGLPDLVTQIWAPRFVAFGGYVGDWVQNLLCQIWSPSFGFQDLVRNGPIIANNDGGDSSNE